jgi:hypothetical protein
VRLGKNANASVLEINIELPKQQKPRLASSMRAGWRRRSRPL